MKKSDVSQALAEHGFMASPDAVEAILNSGDPAGVISYIKGTLDPAKTMVITVEHLGEAAVSGNGPDVPATTTQPPAAGGMVTAGLKTAPPESAAGPPDKGSPPPFEVLRDLGPDDGCRGSYDDFVLHFQDRYRRLSHLLRDRFSPMSLDVVSGLRSENESVSVIGMVASATETKNGHLLIELEDTSGTLKVLVASDSPLRRDVQLLTEDVIAVSGKMGGRGLFIAEAIEFPDVEKSGPAPFEPTDACAAFTSDLHVGSREFLEERFEHFINVLAGRERLPDSNGQIERVRYLMVAGDIVDGIGIYPGQHEDLVLDDVEEQYRSAAKLFEKVPSGIAVFICPGNHDAVRQAEPQPAIPKRFRDGFGENVHFIDNPSTIILGGYRVLMSHGRSIDDLVQNLAGVTYANPQNAMKELLRRRHLSPVYGGRVQTAPETHDRFVISQVPHVIHMGHTHTFGIGEYRGVKLLNTGCWQSQTEFQRRMDIQPEPGKVPVVDLSTGGVSVYEFME